jgi:outer membrane cobalamin receptor
MKLRIIHIIAFALLLPLAGHAINPPDTLRLDTVVVKAPLLKPSATATFRQMDTLSLQAASHQSLGNLLMGHSPLFLKQYGPGSLSTASFRGTAANHTLVLWNDIPLNAPHLGQVDFSSIPVFLVDDVGLLWGSSAARLRSGGIGGVVSLENHPEFNKGWQLDALQSAGSFGSRGSFFSVGYGNSKLQLRTRVFRMSAENNFSYLNTALIPAREMKQEQASFMDFGVFQEISLLGKKSLLKLISWNQWNERMLPPIMTNLERGGKPEEFRNDRFHRNLVSYTYHYNEQGKLEVKSAYFIEKQHYYLRTTTANAQQTVSLIDSRNKAKMWHHIVGLEQRLGTDLTLTAQLHYDVEQVRSSNYENPQNPALQAGSRKLMAAATGLAYSYKQRFTARGSLRQDFINGSRDGFSPSLEISYLLWPASGLTITAGASRNHRQPNLNDLYWYPGGNPDLLAEQSNTLDAGITHKVVFGAHSLTNKAGLYVSKINNWIQWRPSSYRFWVPANISQVLARGLDWHTHLQGQAGPVTYKLLLNYAFTLTTDESPVARFENNAGKQLIYIPKHHGNAFVHLAYKKMHAQWTTTYTGKRSTSLNADQSFTALLPAYTLHHLSIGRQFASSIGSFTLDLRLQNIFNKDYQAVLWRSMPGRHFEGSIRYQL